MAYIKVDHSKFEGAASAVDSYVTLMKNKMRLFTLSVLHKDNHGFATK